MPGAHKYDYKWIHGKMAPPELIAELAELYSGHYGHWGIGTPRSFQRIRLSPKRIQEWLTHSDSRLAFATLEGRIVGYAIAVQPKVPGLGVISWVTQLVVHEEHRRLDVGKRLLYSIWEFSNHFAWGLITANPYAVRALEKATRRRCDAVRISKSSKALLKLGKTHVPYLREDTESAITETSSRINTRFFVDQSGLPSMLDAVVKPDIPWTLGDLVEGWEWFAFTFQDQVEIGLSESEIDAMLSTSDAVAQHAYSRMRLGQSHRWAQYAPSEAEFIMRECKLQSNCSVLDIGCGSGRHVLELAHRGVLGTGVDYLQDKIIGLQAEHANNPRARFVIGDARTLDLEETFDAVLCLYDVIGSYADPEENARILSSIRHHMRQGGSALISVMNLDLTWRRAKHFFVLRREADKLLRLEAGNIMETTGDVFDPDHYMIDTMTEVVYRKEQFTQGDHLPAQLLVRDRRYRKRDIEALCIRMGLRVIWSRYVRAGHWQKELDADDDNAKEILLLCEAV